MAKLVSSDKIIEGSEEFTSLTAEQQNAMPE